MKFLGIFFLIVIVIVSLGLCAYYNKQAGRSQGELDQERYGRMIAEEGWQEAKEKIEAFELENTRLKNKAKSTERLLEQTSAINKELKTRLDKLEEKKAALEKKLSILEELSSQHSTTSASDGNRMN